jgi:hypothetical protein
MDIRSYSRGTRRKTSRRYLRLCTLREFFQALDSHIQSTRHSRVEFPDNQFI